MNALLYGQLEVAQLLIDKGANVAAKDINAMDILHYAVHSNFLSSVQFAVTYATEVDWVDNNGWTPLLRAGKHPIKITY